MEEQSCFHEAHGTGGEGHAQTEIKNQGLGVNGIGGVDVRKDL